MKDPAPWICDAIGCVKRKGPTNKWWLVYQIISDELDGITIQIWNDARANSDGVLHACSESCALKLASDWLARAYQRSVLDQH